MKLNHSDEIRKIMKDKGKLKHVEEGRIYINNDLSETERQIQKERKEESTVKIIDLT